jgi:hypothetical protein
MPVRDGTFVVIVPTLTTQGGYELRALIGSNLGHCKDLIKVLRLG